MIKRVLKIKCIILTVFIVSILLSLNKAQAQDIWTLEECIKYAHKNNINVLQQELGVEIARDNVTRSVSERFPDLNMNATHGYNYGRREGC